MRRQAKCALLPRPHLFLPLLTMSQQPDLELLPRKDRIILAIKAIESNVLLSQQHAAAIYNVQESTLHTQHAGKPSQRDISANLLKLLRHEEEVVIQYIRKLDARGFAPTLSYMREMANQLLAACSGT
jgi:DNA-binding transcriptional regulator YiaG